MVRLEFEPSLVRLPEFNSDAFWRGPLPVMQDVSIRGQGEQESGIGALVASGWSEHARPGYLASLVKRLSPLQSRERLNGLHPRLCCRGLPGVFSFYKEEAPQFTAPLTIAVGKNWIHRGNANFAKEITPVVCPEAQQNPSHPVISESYQGWV